MKKVNSILWGIALVALGVILALNAFGITDINIFFDGWWTLFIIVPCAIGLVTDRDKTGSAIGVLIGVFLLLCCQNILSFSLLWKLLVPVIIVVIGLRMIFGGVFRKNGEDVMRQIKASGAVLRNGTATFSGLDMNFAGEVFEGSELNAVFGGIKCNLNGAVIEKDCVINASAIFGGITIYLPDDINVKTSSTSIFGGMSGKRDKTSLEGKPTLYINATCVFGGVELK